jgi:hypothetical protein
LPPGWPWPDEDGAPARHRCRHLREVADAASSLAHVGANAEDIDQVGKDKDSQHFRLWRGQ